MINWLKKKWYGLNEINNLERLVLNAVREKIEPEARILWDKQIDKINKVSRLPHGVESIFYHINLKTGKPDFDDNIRFPNKKSDLLLAVVRLKFRTDEIEIEVWCERGRVLLLNFKGSAYYWINYLENESANEKVITNCKVIADLMSVSSSESD
ncbi:hypothetical protein [Acinetobacter sp. UC24323]|uniref:hypothetical protein n=1 Tax=Acinetobacter TaxID=469 RepID=UPI00209EB1E2|nr:hypothetical protein [Acinetobacter sp. UC24323]MCO9050793.1 hypothetical protein [Acinetobacter sp. UC24323]MDC4466237.1 hypothetical protein [Acinetobacter baumannii]MDC5596910.1 hypothetical protein [Acinetobacter baumannii]